jgi:peptidylprolyl isomerase
MVKAKDGDTVTIHYTGTLDDGSVFDSSEGREPLEFTLGQGMVIPGFENAVLGMEEGETESIQIESEDAYGEYSDELLFDVARTDLPPNIEPKEGMVLQVSAEDGTVSNVVIKEVADDSIVLDANHPLAGKALHFEINLVSIA